MATTPERVDTGLVKGLGLLDATTIVMGSMIGSGIFIVPADIARQVDSPGLLIMTWLITAALTITAALSYGELAAAMPHAGGQYVYLWEVFGSLSGFLYGWTSFMVIQTGTIAAAGLKWFRATHPKRTDGKAAILDVRAPVRPGSITAVVRRCGKPSRHCAKPNDPGHDPQFRLTRSIPIRLGLVMLTAGLRLESPQPSS
jgi:amino acid transporter